MPLTHGRRFGYNEGVVSFTPRALPLRPSHPDCYDNKQRDPKAAAPPLKTIAAPS